METHLGIVKLFDGAANGLKCIVELRCRVLWTMHDKRYNEFRYPGIPGQRRVMPIFSPKDL
jgi:hypothetical protein